MSGKLTVGSLRGMPQPGVMLAASIARRGPPTPILRGVAPILGGSAPTRVPKRCCGTGCVGCPVGDRIRLVRARRNGG